ncbi:MAG: transcription elongation factor GreA [Treponema sp.]|nr:transcription elongation factor GreA [Treponema sp.]
MSDLGMEPTEEESPPDVSTAAEASPASGLSPEAQSLIKNVREMLNEEKWTRATLGNYSTSQFKEFDSLLKEARQLKAVDELKKNCDEHLGHSKNSIIALYLSGMVALSYQIIDDAAMINLVTIFADNHKWAIVKYLCGRILDYGESKFALRTQIECCKNENDEESMYSFQERLVKADYEDADTARLLAEHFEKLGKDETAVEYYRKALYRYINKGVFANVKEIWEKLLLHCPGDIDFFLHVQKKVAKNISDEKAIDLLTLVFNTYKERDTDTAIGILKTVLQYDEKNVTARREIVECYKRKHAGHSQLDDYIRVSNLAQNFRNVHEAIAAFEKHIAFDKGNYVFHRTWGVGRIAGIDGDDIRIDFAKKRDHTMSLKMAVEALQTLSKEHVWVLRATWKKEKLLEKIKDDKTWALKTIIKSFGNSCDLKRIKAELCPGVLSEKEWTGWSSKAREILRSDPSFGVSPDNIDVFTVREHPISISEKLYNEFKAERNFYHRVAIIRNFASQNYSEDDLENFAEMFSYFRSFLKTSNLSGEHAVASYLLIKELSGRYPSQIKEMADTHPPFAAYFQANFADMFKGITDIPGLYFSLKDSQLKKELIRQIRNVYGWADVYVQLFPRIIDATIIEELEKDGEEKLTALTADCFERYRERREAVVWLYRMYAEAKAKLAAKADDLNEAEVKARTKAENRVKWYEAAGVSRERQIIVLIHLLDITFRDIENQRETTEARKINKHVYNILFKDEVLAKFVEVSERDTVTRIYSFISDLKTLDPQDKMNLRSRIQDKYPDFKFTESVEKRVSQGLTVTGIKYGEKQKQLIHIMEVEIPANSREIEDARQHGDLKENAEYIAAKEKQAQLNTMTERLKEEIDRAQIFDPVMIDTSRVSFGTIVVLKNESRGQTEKYTILGPWESDPENHVISYQTPFGKAMINKVAGDSFQFTSDNENISYFVERIEAATL